STPKRVASMREVMRNPSSTELRVHSTRTSGDLERATSLSFICFCSAPLKQAAQPAATSCSGLVPSPEPPSACGGRTSRSIWRSAVATWPSRPPPVDSAFALYSALLIENSFASCLKPCSAARVYLLAGGEEFLHASGQVFVHVAPVGVALLLHLLGDTGHRTSDVLRQTLALLVVHDVADEAASLCVIIVLRVAAVGTEGQVAAVALVEQTKLISQAGAGFRAAADAALGFTGGHALLGHAGTVGGVLGALATLEAVRGAHRGAARRELIGHRAVLGVVPVQVLADRTVHRQLGVVRAEAVTLGVLVGEGAGEQHLVRGEAHARHDVRRCEGGLLDLREVVLRVLVQREVADVDQRVVLL